MKKYIFLVALFVFSSCETGLENRKIKDEESSNQAVKHALRDHSIEVLIKESYPEEEDRDAFDSKMHPILFDNKDKEVPLDAYVEQEEQEEMAISMKEHPVQKFSGGVRSDGLDLSRIRQAKHKTFFRLVLDSKKSGGETVEKVGSYTAHYDASRQQMVVTIHGYRKFSAKIPEFSRKNVIKKISMNTYLDDSAYQFTIALRQNAHVKVFTLESPARLVFDFTPM